MHDSIVVLGAGIIGLDVALVLAEQGYGRQTTVIAQHLPGDTSIEYTSPWAGANFSGLSGSDENALVWDNTGYKRLLNLARTHGNDAAVKRTRSYEYWDEEPAKEKIKSMARYLEDFSILRPHQLIPGVAFGISFTTITINAPKHIQYLKIRLEKEHGVRFIRRRLDHIDSAFLSKHTKTVFNCVGNAAKSLPGVEDSKCFPTRGQILVARAPHIDTNVMRHGKDYETYIIPRPSSNGNVILGGFMQRNNSTGDTFVHETESIWTRAAALEPSLEPSNTEILAAFAGLRPSRDGGARVEKEDRDDGRIVVHNYGAGGTGFQAGLGMAVHAVNLATQHLSSIASVGQNSKL